MPSLLEKARITTLSNKYNYRLETLAKNLGTNSPIYQNEVSKITYWLPEENIRYKDGIIQIAKPSKLAGNISLSQLENINIKTWQGVKNEYQGAYEGVKDEFAMFHQKVPSLSEYINMMGDLFENLGAVYAHYEDADIQRRVNEAKDIMHQKYNTYSELVDVASFIGELINNADNPKYKTL